MILDVLRSTGRGGMDAAAGGVGCVGGELKCSPGLFSSATDRDSADRGRVAGDEGCISLKKRVGGCWRIAWKGACETGGAARGGSGCRMIGEFSCLEGCMRPGPGEGANVSYGDPTSGSCLTRKGGARSG